MAKVAHPIIACEKCGQPSAKVLKMTVTYQTSLDLASREDVHRHVSTTYELKCPECGHAFSVTRDVADG